MTLAFNEFRVLDCICDHYLIEISTGIHDGLPVYEKFIAHIDADAAPHIAGGGIYWCAYVVSGTGLWHRPQAAPEWRTITPPICRIKAFYKNLAEMHSEQSVCSQVMAASESLSDFLQAVHAGEHEDFNFVQAEKEIREIVRVYSRGVNQAHPANPCPPRGAWLTEDFNNKLAKDLDLAEKIFPSYTSLIFELCIDL